MITTDEMKRLEAKSERLGASRLMLMEHAGRAVFENVERRIKLEEKTAIIFIGPGNNGGDGLVAARYFAKKCFVFVLLFCKDEKLKYEAAASLARIEGNPSIEIIRLEDINEFNIGHIKKIRARNLVLVDAILGMGVKGAVREPLDRAIDLFNEMKGYKVIVDVPSGVNPDNGAKLNHYITSYNILITFHDRKKGISHYPDQIIADIGIPKEAEQEVKD